MTEPIDGERDPLISRASAALRSRTHADDRARAALMRTLDDAAARPGSGAHTSRLHAWLAVGVAAGIILAAGLGLAISGRLPARTTAPTAAPPNTTMVEFSFDAPAARLVSVVGEFNGWNGGAAPMRRAASGRWVTNLALAPGRHTYGFEVDGDGLVPDPNAPVAPEKMFGIRHSVVVVPRGAEY